MTIWEVFSIFHNCSIEVWVQVDEIIGQNSK